MEIFNPDSNIRFMSAGKYSLAIAVILTIASLFLIFGKGLNYGLDFTGGVLVEVSYQDIIKTSSVRDALDQAGFEGAIVQSVGGTRDVVVRIQPDNMDDAAEDANRQADRVAGEVMDALKATRSDVQLKRHSFVGPEVGAQLRDTGVLAMVFVIIGIVVYLSLRFERRFAIAALAQEVHDAIITVGVIALFGREFDMAVLASVMAVIGYSVNDTVVVFDRVRELFRISRSNDVEGLLNRAVNNTLSRTIITSLTTGITMAALYFWGGPATRGFAITMLIGIVLGSFSSIFIGCPLLQLMGVSKKDLIPVKRDDPELARRP